ncbi:DUF7344 domain-containing protein [Haloarcula sp. GH36]|uniref:DUF7344 domain-containing protein n=1 Tax=Haloarcula montana TaxID=3111776 RepID=UPI002D78ED3F|nr:hypothetical protein [Haloarcula sp. GH36]
MSDIQQNEESDSVAVPDQWIDEPMRGLLQRLAAGSVPETAAESATIDEVFDVLKAPEHRYVLTYLLRSEGEITITALVDYVLAKTDSTGDGEELRQRLTTELTTTHLPTLAERGFIEYNMERQLVRESETTAQVEPYLTLALAQQRLLSERDS